MRLFFSAVVLAVVLCPAVSVFATPTPQIKFDATAVGSTVSCQMSCSVFDQLAEFKTFELCAKVGYVFPQLLDQTVSIRGKDEKDVRTWAVARSDDGDRVVFSIDEAKPCTNGTYTFSFHFVDDGRVPLVDASLCASVSVSPSKSLLVKSRVVDESAGKLPQFRLDLSAPGFNRESPGTMIWQGDSPKLQVAADSLFTDLEYEVVVSDTQFGVSLDGGSFLLTKPADPTDQEQKLLESCFKNFTGKINREGRADLLPVLDTRPLKEAKLMSGITLTLRLSVKRKGEIWVMGKPMKIGIAPPGLKFQR